jgi:hypothetical protein
MRILPAFIIGQVNRKQREQAEREREAELRLPVYAPSLPPSEISDGRKVDTGVNAMKKLVLLALVTVFTIAPGHAELRFHDTTTIQLAAQSARLQFIEARHVVEHREKIR